MKKIQNSIFYRAIALLLLTSLLGGTLGGCFKKPVAETKVAGKPVELVYYKLFDDEDIFSPLISQYQTLNPNVKIKYRKFTDPDEYYRTILNELAEGQGPDIISVPNYWLKRNARKLSPIDPAMYSPEKFAETFVSVAEKDSVFVDPKDGVRKVFGFPLAVDTLALYYNKSFYEDRVPSRGRPAPTWDEFKDDVYKLTKEDNSFERFELAGTAMGRADNIARAMDILYLLMLQYKAVLYNSDLTEANFAGQNAVTASGASINPVTEALNLYTSFGLSTQKNYSWNEYMVDADSPVKEVETFARGKVATIFGYSYLYPQIKAEIDQLKQQKVKTIDFSVVKTSPVPQVNNPDTSTEKRDAFANYFVETVGRNCENPDVAWDFLAFITTKDNASYYNQKTNRPTARRDLIEDQMKDPVYGVFAEQVGYAESLDMADADLYKTIFTDLINKIDAKSINVKEAVRKAQDMINLIMPKEGILAKPAVLPKAATTATKATTDTTKSTANTNAK